MQFLNNDSEEWMRKAAEDYPVRPIGMNWEVVACQLQEEEKPQQEQVGYIFLRYAAMVTFFMLLSLVCNKYLRLDFDKRYNATAAAYETSDNPSSGKNNEMNVIQSGFDKRSSAEGLNRDGLQNQITAYTNEDKVMGDTRESDHFHHPNRLLEKSVYHLENGLIEQREYAKPAFPSVALLSSPVMKEYAESRITDPVKEQEQAVNKKGPLFKRGLYAGLVFGPDISSVKLQQTEGVGYNAGILLGYQFSKGWQVESGVLLNRKEYYSSGEYFNTGKMYLPSHAYITNVEGYCNMFEIPLNVRYNISQKKHKWFATAGVSSYLMNKEFYNYSYKRYGVAYKGYKTYSDAPKNWLTVANASVGYELPVSKKMSVRIEPYIKIPLRGMGTGKLPISSTGLNVGLSYPLQ